MWMDDQGVAHTVALPNPAEVMTDDFRRDLDALVATQPAEIEEVLAAAEEQIFERDLSGLAESRTQAQFEGVTPPVGLLDGSLRTASDLSVALARVDLRWRLDAVMALTDYVE